MSSAHRHKSVLKGTLGGQQPVASGENRQVALWGGEDAETLPVTVTFGPVQQVNTVVANQGVVASVRPYGIVKWGTRGWLSEAEVDIGRGVQFTVNASYVSLQVALPPPNDGLAPITMLMSGMLSFYPTTHTPQLTRTIYVTGFDSGTSGLIEVPAFARGVMVLSPVAAGARDRIDIAFIDSSNNTRYTYNYPALVAGAPSVPLDFIPLSGDITSIEISSATPVEDYLDVVFSLAF